jgi:hypothetical protein
MKGNIMATKPKTKEVPAAKAAVVKTKAEAKPKPAAKPVVKAAAKAVAKPVSRTETVVRKVVKKAKAAREIKKQDIEVRAYFLALERQVAGLPAAPLEDWLAAEREFQS